MKKLLLALLLFIPVMSWAQLSTNGLTKEQIAELSAQAAKMRSPEGQAVGISAAVRNETAAWANLGTNIGSAMVSAAKEVGVAANEFSQTGLGKIVTGIVVYKVMGRDILGVIVGSAVLLFGFSMVTWLLLTKRFGEVKYEYHPVLWGAFNRRTITEYKISDDTSGGKFLFGGFVLVMTLIVGLNCIF